MSTVRTVVLVGFALSLMACVGSRATSEQLLARAAFDLECDEHALEVVSIDDRTRGVRGCGKRATYVSSCKTGASQYGTYDRDCTWVLNAANGQPTADAR